MTCPCATALSCACTHLCTNICARMHAHMCVGGRRTLWMPNSWVLQCRDGSRPIKRQPLPPLYTENTVLFSMLARLIALVAHASHRHQPQPDLIPAGLLSQFITPFAYCYRLEQPRPLPGQHGSPSVYFTVRERSGSTSASNKSIDISCFGPPFFAADRLY